MLVAGVALQQTRNMPSEKTRYLNVDNMPLPPAWLERLEVAARSLTREELLDTLLQAAERDLLLQFRLAARLVPLSMEETVTLLMQVSEVILHAKPFLDADAQEALAGVAEALLERGLEQIGDERVMEAAAIGLAILQALEPQLGNVSDEGHTLQRVLADTFSFLASLPHTRVQREVFPVLVLTTQQLLDAIPGDDRHYEADWKQLVQRYRQRSAE